MLHTKIDLIETLWNVKYTYFIPFFASDSDLIETLWNVKFFPVADFRAEQHRI